MLSDPERDLVIEELVKHVSQFERPRETLVAPFFDMSLQRDLTGGTPVQLVLNAVRLCLADGWAHDPPWMLVLLQVIPAPLFTGKLADIRDKLRMKPPTASDPLATTLLGNTPFVNRKSLREYLPQLASDAAQRRPILVVNGEPKTGKTWSIRYIEHFSYMPPLRIVTYRLEFDPEIGLALGPAQVASQLVGMLGRPTASIPPPDTNKKLYVQNLASWVLMEAAQVPAMHWFILDNFRGDQLLPETRDFLVALSDRITTGIQAQICRLILIGFDRALLSVDAGKVHEDLVDVCTAADWRVCIAEVAGRSPVPLAPAVLEPLVLQGLPVGEGRMVEANARLSLLIHAIEGVRSVVARIPGADFEAVLLKLLETLPAGRQERIAELQRRLRALKESAAEMEES